MSRLADRINEIVMREGAIGKSKLSVKSGVSVPTIEKIRKNATIPKVQTAFNLALAAGFSDDEARKIANAYASQRAKERLPA